MPDDMAHKSLKKGKRGDEAGGKARADAQASALRVAGLIAACCVWIAAWMGILSRHSKGCVVGGRSKGKSKAIRAPRATSGPQRKRT